MKRQISQQAEKEACSLTEYLHLNQLSEWWETLLATLKAAQTAYFQVKTP